MLRNKLECNEWNYFVEKFKQLSENVQELILKKLQGELKYGVFNIKHWQLTLQNKLSIGGGYQWWYAYLL